MAVFRFNDFSVRKKAKHFPFDSVQIVDNRIQQQPFINIENGHFPRTRILYDDTFSHSMAAVLTRAIATVPHDHNLLVVNLKEFRVYNNSSYQFGYRILNGQEFIKVNIDLSYQTINKDLKSTRNVKINRFYRFEHLYFLRAEIQKILCDLLLVAEGRSSGSRKRNLLLSGRSLWYPLPGDYSYGGSTDTQVIDSKLTDSTSIKGYSSELNLLSDGRYSYFNFQDLVSHKGKSFKGGFSLDSVTGCYFAEDFSTLFYNPPAFVSLNRELYVRIINKYYLKVDTANNFKIHVPSKFPDLYSVYSFFALIVNPVELDKFYKKNFFSKSLVDLTSGSNGRRKYLADANDFDQEKAKDGTDKYSWRLDPYSGDLLY